MTYFNFDKNTYENLPEIFWKKQDPQVFKDPKILVFNDKLAKELDINIQVISEPNILTSGQESLLTMAYAGYQFGNFVMLGDGRAALLGEHKSPNGIYDIQLKGSGRTPFSRGGDGYAAIMPMLREYIISEFLAAMGIPTSRSLAVATTGQYVQREELLTGAVLTRVAKSHLRVGTFDYASTYGQLSDIKALADYSIDRHYPDLQNIVDLSERYLAFLNQVIIAQSKLVSKWQQIGFVHGVMNTDNMTISGESIDFGPCAFLDVYNQDAVFSSIDRMGRYAYKNQAGIALWNLTRLAEDLLPLFDHNQEKAIEKAQSQLSTFSKIYNDQWLTGMRSKLGLYNYDEKDGELVKNLLTIMEKNQLDYTNTFVDLANGIGEIFTLPEAEPWLISWNNRINEQIKSKEEIIDLMKKHNPTVIPRNHLVEEALQKADNGDMSYFNELIRILQSPFQNHKEKYTSPPEKSYRCITYCGT